MHLFSKLAPHLGAVLLCFCLLLVQAFGDLSLPRYTSLIVDVGIQQSGVDHASVTELSAPTHDAVLAELQASADKDAAKLFQGSYDQQGETYSLNDQGESQRDDLDQAMALPLAHAYGLAAEGADQELVAQQGIAAAQREYQALGYDLNQMQMGYLLRTGGIMLALAALIMAAMIAVSYVASRTGARIGRDLRDRFFSQVMQYSEAEVDSFSAASLITRGTNDVQLIQMSCIMLLRMVVYAPILAAGGVVMVAVTAPSMAWIIAVAVVALLALVGVLMAVTMPRFLIIQQLIDKVNQSAREILTGLPVIRAFGRESHEQGRFEVASEELLRTQLFTSRAMILMMPGMQMIMNGVSVAIVWFGGISVSMGTLQTGQIIALITYSMVIIMGFLMLGMIAVMLPRAEVAAQRVDEVLATTSTVVDPVAPRDADLPSMDQAPGASIEFRDVCFAYDPQGENVLDHVSFTVDPGSTCAIVGSTGSGKSTVLKLIERFRDVGSGQVLVDGIDVRDLSQAALRAQFGYVPQKAFLFGGTVRSNVAYADESLSDEALGEALRIAQAADFVAQRDQGAESAIAQSGSNVSGGQRQRLAIARAVAAPARAYLFDDSFSALDYKTDAALREELASSLTGRTVLIVAQRIATIMNADRIVVLDEGRVVGVGTHAQLLEGCAAYRQIAESQLSAEELSRALPAGFPKGGERA